MPRTVLPGCPLTSNQLDTLKLSVLDGLTYKEIAERSDRTESTIRSTMLTVHKRLGVGNQAQALVVCLRDGWIEIDGFSARRPANEQTRAASLGIALDRIENTLGDIAQAINDRDPTPVSGEQFAYLESFEAWLSNEDEDPARQGRRDVMLGRLEILRTA